MWRLETTAQKSIRDEIVILYLIFIAGCFIRYQMKDVIRNSMSKQHTEMYALNEQAITLVFGDEIKPELAEKISAFNTALHLNPFPGFKTAVPAYTTLTVFYDPLLVFTADLKGNNCFEKAAHYLENLDTRNTIENAATDQVTIPVCYGGDLGPDLAEVAAYTKIPVEEVVRLHSSAVYQVYMIGFIPGFAYLGGMDERLSCPRKAQPRASVPAGAVGIAGQQTGIYPLETPGGWQIIGQTPLSLFDINRPRPSLLKAGDLVSFKPVSLQEFKKIQGS